MTGRGVIVIRLLLAALAISACSVSMSAAQDPPATPPAQPPVTQPPATQPPATPTQEPLPAAVPPPGPVPKTAPTVDADTFKRRQREIDIMEGVLIGAVRGAAMEMTRVLDTPGASNYQLSGSLGARGFPLEGYGVFFHVEIPGVQPTVVSIEALRLLEQRQGPSGTQSAAARTSASDSGRPPALGTDADYVERVTAALIDAMIKYSMPLELEPHEWFIVAASPGDLPLTPVFLVPRSTMILRLKGSDVADYMAKRVTLEEVRRRVDVRRF